MSHIIPFKSRGFSGPHTDHLLFKDNKIYIMDNHRLALWSWNDALNLTNSTEQFNLLHIDAHPDMSDAALNEIQKLFIDWTNISIQDYQNFWQKEYNIPLIRWDNYLTIFLDQFSKRVNFENTFSSRNSSSDKPKLSFAKLARTAVPQAPPSPAVERTETGAFIAPDISF